MALTCSDIFKFILAVRTRLAGYRSADSHDRMLVSPQRLESTAISKLLLVVESETRATARSWRAPRKLTVT